MRAPSWKVFSVLALGVVISLGSALSYSQDADSDAKVKHTIKEGMKIAHGKDSGLLKKVLGGQASDEEKKQLLDAYISLVEGKPGQGEQSSWQLLSGKAALAAAKVFVGREGAIQELEAATNCKACHSVHKGS